jgi:hypothetical protein
MKYSLFSVTKMATEHHFRVVLFLMYSSVNVMSLDILIRNEKNMIMQDQCEILDWFRASEE